MKAKEFLQETKSKSENQLNQLAGSLRDEIRELRFKSSQNQLKEVRKLRVLKKNLARTMTLLKAKIAAK